jgi:phage anti-repressor protein
MSLTTTAERKINKKYISNIYYVIIYKRKLTGIYLKAQQAIIIKITKKLTMTALMNDDY